MATKVGDAYVEISTRDTGLVAGLGKAQKNVSASMKAIGRSMAIAGAAITAAFGYTIKGAMDFEAILKRVEIQSGATATEMEEIKRIALSEEMIKLGKSGSEVADVFNRLASEGYSVAAMRKMLIPIVETLIVLGTEEGETTKLMLNLMQQYELEAKDMAMISDILAGALANTSFQGYEIVESFKYAGVAAGSLGWSLAGTIPIIDAIIKVTGEAAMAGTQFRMMIQKLRDPTKEMIEDFDNLGITMDEVAEAIKTPTGLVELLNKVTTEGGDVIKMFGVRAGSAAEVISRQSVPAIIALTEKISEQGFAHEATGKIMETTKGQVEAAMAAFQNFRTEIGDFLLPILKETLLPAIQNILKVVRKWVEDNKPLVEAIVKWSAGIGVLMLVLGPLLMMLPGLVIAISGLGVVIGAIVSPIGLVIAAVAALAIAWKTDFLGIKSITIKVIDKIEETLKRLRDSFDKTTKSFTQFTDSMAGGGGAAGAFADEIDDLAEKTKEVTKTFEDYLAEVNKMAKETEEATKRLAEMSDIMQPAIEAIQKIIDTMTPYEKQLEAINKRYDEAINKIGEYITNEEELEAAIVTLNEGRESEITLLDRQVTALEKVLEAKQKLIDATKSLADRIFELTHTAMEINIKKLDEQRQANLDLGMSIEEVNEWYDLEIAALNELTPKEEKNIEVKEELINTYEDLSEVIEETTKVTQFLGQSFTMVAKEIDKASTSLNTFTTEAVAAAIAQIKMHYYPEMKRLTDLIKEAGHIRGLREWYEADLKVVMEAMLGDIETIKYGFEEYNKEVGKTPSAYERAKAAARSVTDSMVSGWKSVTSAVNQATTATASVTGGTSSWGISSYQHGTPYVPQTGLAIVHEGERITPANQNTYNQQKSFSSINIQPGAININSKLGAAYDGQELFRQLEIQIKMRGLKLVRV